MPHSFGKRARTREKYSKAFRKRGMAPLGTLQVPLKQGDIVDIICDPSQQKGMPFSYYHGRTGKVFAVFPRSVGVYVKKVVRHRQILKRLLIRCEHVRLSRVQECFKTRVKDMDAKRALLKLNGIAKSQRMELTKRQPKKGKGEINILNQQDNCELLAPADMTVTY